MDHCFTVDNNRYLYIETLCYETKYINTGNPGRQTYANGVYYPHNKFMYIGWD